MKRMMLNAQYLPKYFWVQAINTVCYVANHVLIRQLAKNTSMSFGMEENLL